MSSCGSFVFCSTQLSKVLKGELTSANAVSVSSLASATRWGRHAPEVLPDSQCVGAVFCHEGVVKLVFLRSRSSARRSFIARSAELRDSVTESTEDMRAETGAVLVPLLFCVGTTKLFGLFRVGTTNSLPWHRRFLTNRPI